MSQHALRSTSAERRKEAELEVELARMIERTPPHLVVANPSLAQSIGEARRLLSATHRRSVWENVQVLSALRERILNATPRRCP